MQFCNNCGNKLQDNVKFCVDCGAQVGAVLEYHQEEEKSHGKIYNNVFSYNGIKVDLKDIKIRHGKNKINAIKELRSLTGISLKDAKNIIDVFYAGKQDEFKITNTIETTNNNKGCLNMFLWILFLPLMLIKQILKTEKYSNGIKMLLIIGSIIISFPHIMSYVVLLLALPQVIIVIGIIYLIYRYKKKKEDEAIEIKRLEEEQERNKLEKNNKMVNETLDVIFDSKEMTIRLKEFVLQHTKKYDNDQIDYKNYLEKIDLFLVYINKMIDSKIKMTTPDYPIEIIEYWGKEELVLERQSIEKFIENKKMKIYSDDIRKLINVDEYKDLGDVIYEYIDLFGENALKELNLEILSNALGESYDDISILVNKEFNKIKKEYEMRKLEVELFKSDATLKGMEYIDTLSGFEFEDYLEELFTGFGYAAKELPYSNDYGADLIISKGFNQIVIQAKNYSTNVGNKAVQEVIAAKSYYKCDIGMVITNAYYTQNAIKTAEASDIILIDRDGLERIINEGSIYFNSIVS